MSYSVHWYIPEHIIFTRYWGVVTVEEIVQNTQEINQMVDASRERSNGAFLVHNLIDLLAVKQTISLLDVPRLAKQIRPNPYGGWVLTVGQPDKIARFTSNLARQLIQARTGDMDTMEEALAFLHQVDANISWNLADQDLLMNNPYLLK